MNKLLALFCFLFLFNCNKEEKNTVVYTPPKILGQTAIDNYFGKEIIDDYRNLENTEDSIVKTWFKKQTQYSNTYLSQISNKDTLAKQMETISNRKASFSKKINVTDNNQYFYLKRKKDEDKYKLYYKKTFNSNEELLFDPINFNKIETNIKYKINYIKPSWNGEFIVVSLSHSGKELSKLVIIDMKTKLPMSQIISNAWPSSYLGINWLPDSSGFMFLYFPISNSKDPEFKNNSKSVLYKIGDKTNNLKTVFSAKTQSELNINANEFPIAKIKSKNDKYIIGYIAGVDNYWDAYYVETSAIEQNPIPWKPLYKKEHKVITAEGLLNKDEFIYKSALNASNFNISSVSFDSLTFNNPKVLVEEKNDEVIDVFKLTTDGLFYTTSKNGVEANLYHKTKTFSKKIELPKKSGSIKLDSKGSSYQDLWVSTDGWLNSLRRFRLNVNNNNEFISENITATVDYTEYNNFIIDELLVKSHDGEEVPLTVIYNKNISKNSKNPTLFYGYGAYGDALNPFFSPVFLTWVQNGGILCFPHVRGGDEKGEKWRKGGFKTTKPNTWKDLIACTEYMIDQKYTSKNNTVICGGSAGGIMVGGAMTERPDLFKVALVDAGVLNPLRRSSYSGGSSYKEYGKIEDSIECMALIEMDAYLKIKKDVIYPATFLNVGINDTRVAPWMSGKYIAKLQSYNTSNNPMLFKVKYDEGHSGGSSSNSVYQDWASKFSFALWQTGHPDYQLKD